MSQLIVDNQCPKKPIAVSVASFDVFDTLLTRKVGAPEAVFRLLGRRLATRGIIPCSAEVFARLRCEAEHRARRNIATCEPPLASIYDEIARSLHVGPEACTRLMREEIDLETELLVVVPESRELVASARLSGARVVFVSDMYLPREIIVSLLQRHNLCEEGDECLVSVEHGVSKAQGGLFNELLRRTGARPQDVTHTGNHPGSDCERPKALGLNAVFYDRANLNRFERLLEAYSCETEGLSSDFAGASRLARLAVPAESEHHGQIRDIAASVVGPVLAGYIIWVLRRARDLGFKRLYFVSRDGQILLDVARPIALKLGINCDLRYLYGGRQAWHLPCVSKLGKEECAWIFEESTILTVCGQFARVGLDPEGYRAQLEAAGFSSRIWTDNLPQEDRQRLRDLLCSKNFTASILRVAAERRNLLLEYLRQEGVLAGGRWGVVDVGWRGRLLSSLAALVTSAGGTPPCGLYFGLTEATADGGERFAYLFDRGRQEGFVQDTGYVPLPLEMFCAADHGVVLGYERTDAGVKVKLKEERNTSAEQWGLAVLQRTVRVFADALSLDGELVNPWADVRKPLLEALNDFWLRPTRGEAIAWSRFEFEHDQAGESRQPVAEPYTMGDLVPALMQGSVLPKRQVFWVEGGLAQTAASVKWMFWLTLGLRMALGRGLRAPGRWMANRLRGVFNG
jgi:FMN phosphatase YigB (HAD superfamily)